jgi:hypothetical protein
VKNDLSIVTPYRPIEISVIGLFIVIATFFAGHMVMTRQASVHKMYDENRIDPLVFRAAGQALHRGESPYSTDNQADIIANTRMNKQRPPFTIPFSYPPNALPFFWLRAIGDPVVNVAVHMCITVFFFLTLYSLLIFKFITNQLSRLMLLTAAAFTVPSFLDILLGQTGHLTAMLICSFLLLFHKKPVIAGIVLGILAFKPQYAIPLGLIAVSKENWNTITASALTFGATCAASTILFGIDIWSQFWISANTANTTMPFMSNWLGVAALFAPQRIEQWHMAAIPIFALSMSALGILLWRLRHRIDLLDAASLAIMVTVIFSPNTHPYDLLLTMIPVLSLTRHYKMKFWVAPLFMALYSVPLLITWQSHSRFMLTAVSFFILLWLLKVITKNTSTHME